ncbi:hypothetical protein [Eikenella corrodens]|uniref:hypothetical protein n=1 Tax=Eikenella corrodens TaxID=539 RepID=UPI00129A55C6|nr:hypothetical protein [Eikenella corrodens]
MTAYKHADLMLLYAKDAAETDKPWERWEWRNKSDAEFLTCQQHPSWKLNHDYRRKPQVINVGRHEFPKPISNAPLNGTDYFFVMSENSCFKVNAGTWVNSKLDNMRLGSSRLHLTREAAQAHADVLNAICRGDVE